MDFRDHSNLKGQHAFLSASKYHWVNYDIPKLEETYLRHNAALKGTELHEFAEKAINLGIRLPRNSKTLNMFVNDAIGFKMQTEQVLYFSENAFGTADAISFKKSMLRIHDYKSGVTPASMRQLEVYAALFCLEYDIQPEKIEMELRIYQNDEIIAHDPDRDDIRYIMEKIIEFDKIIDKIKLEG